MTIGYSEETLWNNITKQLGEIRSECNWATVYKDEEEVGCVEDCVQNIIDSCTAIMENLECLKGEKL
jgi:hypothetical protein